MTFDQLRVKFTINIIYFQKNPYITNNGEFPLPDIQEEALEYVYKLTSLEMEQQISKENIV